jgi:hypothetical protein
MLYSNPNAIKATVSNNIKDDEEEGSNTRPANDTSTELVDETATKKASRKDYWKAKLAEGRKASCKSNDDVLGDQRRLAQRESLLRRSASTRF